MIRPVLGLALVLAVLAAQAPVTPRDITLTITEGTAIAAAASPDRRTIAIDLLGGIWTLPMSGGDAKRITPEDLEARNPAWSPDGGSIAFQGFDADGIWHIYVCGRNGEQLHAVTSGEFDDREPAWSRDGSRIAFTSDRYGGIITAWDVRLDSGELRRRSARDASMPVWSSGDRELLFVSSGREDHPASPATPSEPESGVYAVDNDGRERLVRPSMSAVAAATSPDAARIAITTMDGRLEIAQMRGVPMASIATGRDRDVFPTRPQWLSRSELLYTADGHIKRLSLDAGAETIPFRATLTVTRGAYTIAHRQLEPLGEQKARGIVSPVVAPNGRAIAFVALGDLWVQPVGGTPVRVTDDAAMEIDPAWSPDSLRLAFATDRTGHMQLWIHDFVTNTDHQVTDGPHVITGPAWSPDGNHLAFVLDRAEIGVVTIRPDSHPMIGPTFVAHGDIGRPTWSADNHVVAVGDLLPYSDRYAHGLNQLLLFAMDPPALYSSVLVRGRSAGNREHNGPVWSPDGFRFAFVGEGKLWTVNVDGKGAATGPPAEIADDQPESPSWEGDMKHLVYQTPAGMRRILSDGGSAETIPIDLSWTPTPPPERVVVHAGHLVDGVFESIRGECDIVIDRGIIREVVDHRDALHQGAVIDASDEVVMPGLIDSDVRLDPAEGAAVGRAWLVYGVTSVRAVGAGARAALEARESFDAGRRPGPRLFVSGESFDGIRRWPRGGVAITSDEQLDRAVDRAAALGVDFFTTDVRLAGHYGRRLTQAAHDGGRPVFGHDLSLDIASGADAIEGLPRTVYGDAADLIAKSGVSVLPTLAMRGELDARLNGDRSLLFDPRLAVFPLPLVSRLTDIATAPPRAELERVVAPYETALKAVVTAGGTIVAGTRSPIVPHGLGLHVELESYVHAGLSPFQALQTATVNAAQLIGCDRELGTVEAGKIADLVFVGGDPLIDIRRARDVKRVMKGGRIYSVAELIKAP